MVTTELSAETVVLSSIIRVRQSSIRSVHIEQDLRNSLVIDEYLLTAQSRTSLTRILGRLFSQSPTRAWTLTGPYGSGKSYFSLFLMNLICAANPGHQRALDALQEIDPYLADQVSSRFDVQDGMGLLAVPITGYRAPIQECLQAGLKKALYPFITDESIHSLYLELEDWSDQTTSREIIDWIARLKDTLIRSTYHFQGVVFVLDEMGKTLEFAAANPDKSDIYLFQELAELANRSGDYPIVFIGILHQAFERYASLMSSAAQREWAKVQGRFEDIAYQEPPALQMELVARALEAINGDKFKSLDKIIEQTAELADRNGWRPGLFSQEKYIDLCKKSYPFHPSALIALPLIFKRLAQNERSIFAYLASSEPFGFQEFLHRHDAPHFLRLHHLFDYLAANFQARIYASGRSRQITETLDRISNSPNLEPLELDLLKTIGLINWLAESSSIQATEPLLISALLGPDRNENQIRHALNRLINRSLIVYRRFNGTFNIWQGSDVDIEARIDEAHQKLRGAFSFAEIVQRYMPPRPIVARRHSYETGTLRYFEVCYVDASNYQDIPLTINPGSSGLVLLALPVNQNEVALFKEWATSSPICDRMEILVGIASRSLRLADLARELRALNWVKENTPELRDDPVARRELRARLAAVETLIHNELDERLNLHRLTDATECEWYWQGARFPLQQRSNLSHILSGVCDHLYEKSPIIRNELINRRILTSQAAAARRNLIEGMLTRANQPLLGIQGYPPERSIYESLLKKSGLHIQHDNEWILSEPLPDDPLNLRPVWDAIAEFIFSPPIGPRRVEDLYRKLESPPYGVASGVLPVLLCAFLQVNSGNTTLYREGTLLPDPGIADWEVLLRRPELFDVAGCHIEKPLQKILDRFGRAFNVKPEVMPIVRIFVRNLMSLPEHARRTNRLPNYALAIRRAIEKAHSPEKLLFRDLPSALGIEPFDEVLPSDNSIEEFFNRLNKALADLVSVINERREWARDFLLEACGMSKGETEWENFRDICSELTPQVTNLSLLPLLKRASESEDEKESVESVIAYIASRPIRFWSDTDIDRFKEKAQAIGQKFKEERISYLPSPALPPEKLEWCKQIALRIKDEVQHDSSMDPALMRAVYKKVALELLKLEREEQG